MSKIKILLSVNANREHYIKAITGVGATPRAEYLPCVNTDYDGLILCGGNDIHPKYYNEPINGSVKIDVERDALEFRLLKAYIELKKPVMGICRGFQLINIFFGGSLYQGIEEKALHVGNPEHYPTHNVRAADDSIISRLYGEHLSVNSSHHQAIKVLGENLKATAFWQDKYTEAFEHTSLPVFGVQWHPEKMCFDMQRDDTVDGAKLFEYFIKLCEEHKINNSKGMNFR